MKIADKVTKFLRNKYVVWTMLLAFFVLIFFLNLYFMAGNKYSSEKINYTFKHLLEKPENAGNSWIHDYEFKDIKEHIWSLLATVTGAIGLAIAGLVTQALTRNPLADASTLGMTQSGIFGIVLALSFGMTAYYAKFSLALVFGVVSVMILLLIISFSKGSISSTAGKVILTGLAIGIIFKTFTFLIRNNDKFLNSVSFNYVLGGAESVNRVIGNNQFEILFISMGLIAIAGILTFIASKGLTLLELGDERAKNLGVKVKLTKVLSLISVGLAVPSSIMVVGNVAFIGLFSVHLARFILRTRGYKTLMLPTMVIAVVISSFGLLLTQYVPKINSGLWMTFLGAPYLVYAGIRGLK